MRIKLARVEARFEREHIEETLQKQFIEIG